MTRRSSEEPQALETYLEHLRALPFVERVHILVSTKSCAGADAVFVVKTKKGEQRLRVEWKKSHLTTQVAEHLIANAKRSKGQVLLLAPKVGRNIAQLFTDSGVNYLDHAGNCHIALGSAYIAHIEGRRELTKAPQARSLRVPSLLVLFTLLARPKLIGASTRNIALAAGGVSPQTATDMRKRLIALGCISANGRDLFWQPKGKERALELLIAGYDQLAAHLELGRFRPRPGSIKQVEDDIAQQLKEAHVTWSWGGGAALYRRNRFYRGTRTIAYVDTALPGRLAGLVPDVNGEVIFARAPGQCAWDEKGRIVSLLIYLDLLTEGEPRALEAAQELRPMLFEELPA